MFYFHFFLVLYNTSERVWSGSCPQKFRIRIQSKGTESVNLRGPLPSFGNLFKDLFFPHGWRRRIRTRDICLTSLVPMSRHISYLATVIWDRNEWKWITNDSKWPCLDENESLMFFYSVCCTLRLWSWALATTLATICFRANSFWLVLSPLNMVSKTFILTLRDNIF